ncbi:MAG TPA: hypothetical protein PLK28_00210 [Candidatus Rifleibacterium sp.]|nr:hypothetical protein [Candidatus Rifleibacterium sp.]
MKKILLLMAALLFAGLLPAAAISRCRGCSFLVNSDTAECPKCLKLLRWPFVPERSRRGRVVVRTGTDAFIRHPHANNRSWRDNRNAGGDHTGEIGVWGGPTTLRYLLRFEVAEAFALAGVNLAEFDLKRVYLKITSDKNQGPAEMPVVIYPLTRPFQEGSDKFRTREKKHRGCDWYYSAPLLTWHSEGGDFDRNISCRGVIKGGGNVSYIEISEMFRGHWQTMQRSNSWQDFGMIIMADPQKNIAAGFVTIFSLESRAHGQTVRSPELYFE